MLPRDIQRLEHIAEYCEDIAETIDRFGNDYNIFCTDKAYHRPFLVSYSCCTIKSMQDFIVPKYVYYVLKTPMIKAEINRYINKTTQPNVGLASIKRFLFPLPPFAEQKRIVARLEELLPLCEKLK